jgi:carbon-monoxide dehydrogenase small subunit/xanthine dehydrogenase small subunit
VRFTLNGRIVDIQAHPMRRLLDVLREECGLKGTKEGCGEGECGACTVLLDGRVVNACLVPFAQVRDARVTTIEGLRGRHALQRAFIRHGGAQCGICTPGMILAAAVLPKRATLDGMRDGLAGNLCRCTGYAGILRSVEAARAQIRPRSVLAAPRRAKTTRSASDRRATRRPAPRRSGSRTRRSSK